MWLFNGMFMGCFKFGSLHLVELNIGLLMSLWNCVSLIEDIEENSRETKRIERGNWGCMTMKNEMNVAKGS